MVQNCFGFSDEGTEDAIYDSQAIRRFVGIDLSRDVAPDATTLLKACWLLEVHRLTEVIFSTLNAQLAEQGLFLRQGTIVDATIIAAPSSTKNDSGKRDPEMHQTKKGNQWHFGMKAHIEQLEARIRAKVEHPFHVVRTSLVIARPAIGAWPRTRLSSSPSLFWPIWCSRASGC